MFPKILNSASSNTSYEDVAANINILVLWFPQCVQKIIP